MALTYVSKGVNHISIWSRLVSFRCYETERSKTATLKKWSSYRFFGQLLSNMKDTYCLLKHRKSHRVSLLNTLWRTSHYPIFSYSLGNTRFPSFPRLTFTDKSPNHNQHTHSFAEITPEGWCQYEGQDAYFYSQTTLTLLGLSPL